MGRMLSGHHMGQRGFDRFLGQPLALHLAQLADRPLALSLTCVMNVILHPISTLLIYPAKNKERLQLLDNRVTFLNKKKANWYYNSFQSTCIKVFSSQHSKFLQPQLRGCFSENPEGCLGNIIYFQI
jgi:hypothetical protein